MKPICKNIFLLVIIFGFSFGVKAQEYSTLNDPVFSDTDYNENDDFKTFQTALKSPLPSERYFPQHLPSPDKEEFENSLVESDVKIETFSLDSASDYVSEKISEQLEIKNLSLDKLSFGRVGGNKIFTLEQVKSSKLNVKFSISKIEVNENEDKFIATLRPEKGNYEIAMKGSFSASQKIPFFARNISKDTIVTQDDIELKDFPKNKLNGNYITEINDIIGKSASKNLIRGNAVLSGDVKNAIIVNKNSSVSAIYRSGAIEVKALAIALEDGGAGDVIRLKNFDSGKQFRAEVQQDGTVLVK